MAHLTDTSRSYSDVSLLSRLGNLPSELADRFARFRRFHETLNELTVLSDRDLADVGLHRSQLRDIAAQAAYGA